MLSHSTVMEIRERRQLASLGTSSLDIGPAVLCMLGPLGDPRCLSLLITEFTKYFSYSGPLTIGVVSIIVLRRCTFLNSNLSVK